MIRCLLTSFRRSKHDRRGVAAVEFALIAPVIIIMLAAAVDIGTAVDRSIRLENAARTAAQYATRAPDDTTGAQNAALAMLTAIPGWSGATVTVNPMACECLDSSGAGSGSPDASGCAATCPNGMARYVSVTATRPFTPIFPISTFIPGASTSNVVARM